MLQASTIQPRSRNEAFPVLKLCYKRAQSSHEPKRGMSSTKLYYKQAQSGPETCVFVTVFVCVCVFMGVPVCVYIYIYVYINVCIYVYIYIYIYISLCTFCVILHAVDK